MAFLHGFIDISSGLPLEMGKYFTKRISVANIIERAAGVTVPL